MAIKELNPVARRFVHFLDWKAIVEKIWLEFFTDPSQWWDHRSDKVNARYPDFRHKRTQASLWLDGKLNPPWVEAELDKIAPGSVQCSIFSWNRRLVRCVKARQYEKTIDLFEQMQQEGMNPDRFTFTPVLNACASLKVLELGRRVHAQIIQSGCQSDVYLGNSLVDMYSKCGSIDDARSVFNNMHKHDVVCWSAMIRGHVKCGQAQEALKLYGQMQQEGVDPVAVTFLSVLNACASAMAIDQGRHVHEQIIQRGLESDEVLACCLVDMYAKCGSMEDAWGVLNTMLKQNVVAWNALILGHVKHGQAQKALKLFWQMQQEGMEPVPVTFAAVLNACASLAALEEGRHVHEHISKRGCESDVFVGNSLVDMYAKCGSMEDALRVFDKMPKHDVYGWSSMIQGYVKSGQGQKALDLYHQMQLKGLEPDAVVFVAVLNACANVVALENGRRIHERISQGGCEADVFVGSSLVAMYAKCGSIEEALVVFNKMPTHNAVSWSTMLGGLAMHGYAMEAIVHFERMCAQGVEMDGVTFVSLLSACCHGGLLDEGLHYFESMSSVYFVSPEVDHYACMIDLLGRAGHLHKAEALIKVMSCQPNATIWTALLGACRIHGNMEIGEHAAERFIELDPGDAAGYVLLSNMFAAGGKWGTSVKLQEQRLKKGSD